MSAKKYPMMSLLPSYYQFYKHTCFNSYNSQLSNPIIYSMLLLCFSRACCFSRASYSPENICPFPSLSENIILQTKSPKVLRPYVILILIFNRTWSNSFKVSYCELVTTKIWYMMSLSSNFRSPSTFLVSIAEGILLHLLVSAILGYQII